MVDAIWDIWLELAPWLLLGASVAGLMNVLIPAGWMKKHLNGRMGVLKAVLVGVPLPLCSCGVIPVGLGLRKSGASNGAAVGFLISTPQTGVDSILVSASFLGWPFAILKVGVALVTGLIGGWLADLRPDSMTDDTVATSSTVHATGTAWQRFLHNSVDLIQSIWGWLVIGALVSACITWLVPENSLSKIPLLSGFSALVITLLISLPLYVCATASVPIAAALVAAGLPSGAALVFLMAGPATNVATLGAVYRTLGGRTLIVYLGTIIAGSFAAGLAFNSVLPFAAAALHAHDHTSAWWRVASAIVLAAMIVWFAVDDFRSWLRKRLRSTASEDSMTLTVDGMTCNGCASKLEKALASQPGVTSADVSFDQRRATVSGTVSHAAVVETVCRTGFSVVENDQTLALK